MLLLFDKSSILNVAQKSRNTNHVVTFVIAWNLYCCRESRVKRECKNLHIKQKTVEVLCSLAGFITKPPKERRIKYQLEHFLIKTLLYFSISLSDSVVRVLEYVIYCFCRTLVVGLGGRVMRKEKYLLQCGLLKTRLFILRSFIFSLMFYCIVYNKINHICCTQRCIISFMHVCT